MNVIYSVKLNVSEKNVLKPLIVKQNDSNSRYIDCAFMHGRFMLLIRSGNVILNVTRADGQKRSFAGTINDNGTVRIPVANWMVENAGMLDCDISVIDGGEKLTSALFSIEVQASAHPDGSVSPDDPAVDVATILVERAEAAAAEAELAAEQIETEFGGAGIHGESYTTIFDEASAMTELHDMDYPYAVLSNTSDLIHYNKTYRITFDGTTYVIIPEMWFSNVHIGKNWTIVGNATLLGGNLDGFIGNKHEDLPFMVTEGAEINGEFVEALYLFTPTAGTHTVKIEIVTYTFTQLPHELVNGFTHDGIRVVWNGVSSYNGYSIGENKLVSKRATIGIGFGNTLNGDASIAIGNGNAVAARSKAIGADNTVSAADAVAVGRGNEVSGQFGTAIGRGHHVTGQDAIAIGQNNTASGQNSCAVGGAGNTASGAYSFASGVTNKASGIASCVFGNNCEADGVGSSAFGVGTKATHLAQKVFGVYNAPDPSTAAAGQPGTYLEIVGNGASNNARSNARTLDWSGNESLAGSITLGKGTEDEVTLTAAQLKRLIALLS